MVCLFFNKRSYNTHHTQGCICRGGGWGVELPAKISHPPLLLLKKRKGGRLSMYLCISTVVDFNSQNFDPPPDEI